MIGLRLQKQANFINQFGEGLIWNNVVIVAKQPGSFNLEQAIQGTYLLNFLKVQQTLKFGV